MTKQSTVRVAIQIAPDGALVSCAAYRNADLLADMARTVDHISGGRLILGIGAGFREWEEKEYGYHFGSPGQRVRELGEALQRIEHRLTALNPRPTRKIPILVAADGPKALDWSPDMRTSGTPSPKVTLYARSPGSSTATATR